MKINKALYLPVDAVSRHEDFDVYYGDDTVAMHFTGDWKTEKDRVSIIGRMGGEIGSIKPDHRTLTYTINHDRYSYTLHTFRIFQHYLVEGMRWTVDGSPSEDYFEFVHQDTERKDVRVKAMNFKGHGRCFEIFAQDIARLRIATAAIVGMQIKEEYRGLSEGMKRESTSKLDKAKNFLFSAKPQTYEQVLEEMVSEGNEKAAEKLEALRAGK